MSKKQKHHRVRNHIKKHDEPIMEGVSGKIWRVRIVSINDFEYCSAPENLSLSRGDFVVTATRYGNDLGRILGSTSAQDRLGSEQIYSISRIATEEDMMQRRDFEVQEEKALKICQEQIDSFNLPMVLLKAHYVLGDSKLVFFFTAESRIDFRYLVRTLIPFFKVRIELRHIGARESSRLIGGLAVCGREYCCSGLTNKLPPVTIKMAKEQNLSLNTSKISGACGRLLCCLSYEYDHYCKQRKQFPKEGISIEFEGSRYKVSSVNVLSQSVTLGSSKGTYLQLPLSRFVRNKEGRGWHVLPD